MAKRGGNGSNGGGGNGGGPGIPFEPGNPFRFRPGKSGNPSGLPGRRADPALIEKFRAIKPRLDAKLLEYWDLPCDVKPFASLGMTWGSVWIRALYVNGIRGKPTAIRELHERIWGKVPLPIKLTQSIEVSEESLLLRSMTDEELTELERVTTEAESRERLLLDVARRRLGLAPIDVPASEVEPDP